MSHFSQSADQAFITGPYSMSFSAADYKSALSSYRQWCLFATLTVVTLVLMALKALWSSDFIMVLFIALLCVPASAAGVLFAQKRRAFQRFKVVHDLITQVRDFGGGLLNGTLALNTATVPFTLSASMSSDEAGVVFITVRHVDPLFRVMHFKVDATSLESLSGHDLMQVFPALIEASSPAMATDDSVRAISALFAQHEASPKPLRPQLIGADNG